MATPIAHATNCRRFVTSEPAGDVPRNKISETCSPRIRTATIGSLRDNLKMLLVALARKSAKPQF
jgi:hypothetical protein